MDVKSSDVRGDMNIERTNVLVSELKRKNEEIERKLRLLEVMRAIADTMHRDVELDNLLKLK